jgi:hypothetical protein
MKDIISFKMCYYEIVWNMIVIIISMAENLWVTCVEQATPLLVGIRIRMGPLRRHD